MQHLPARASITRRIPLVALMITVAMMSFSAIAPSDALAVRDPSAVLSGHDGWVYVRTSPNRAQLLQACLGCPVDMVGYRDAYRWTNAWNPTRVRGGTQVYAYPYSGMWHWIWTQHTGWLAMQTSDLETGYSCTGLSCPRF